MNDSHIYTKRFHVFMGILAGIAIVAITSTILQVTIFSPTKYKRVYENLAAVSITASSLYILDADSNEVIMERQATTPRPIASITKVMSAIVALDLWPKEELIEATLPHKGSSETFTGTVLLNEKWRLQNLLRLMLTKSSNEAAEALVAHAGRGGVDFISKMNEKAREMNFWQTSFRNSSGLDLGPSIAGALSSAEDVAFMLKTALNNHPELFETTVSKGYNAKSEAGTDYFVENTNKVADFLPGLLASKTGFTDLAGGNLAYALRMKDGTRVVVVILGSTKEGRFTDAERITQALTADFKANKLDSL